MSIHLFLFFLRNHHGTNVIFTSHFAPWCGYFEEGKSKFYNWKFLLHKSPEKIGMSSKALLHKGRRQKKRKCSKRENEKIERKEKRLINRTQSREPGSFPGICAVAWLESTSEDFQTNRDPSRYYLNLESSLNWDLIFKFNLL